MSFRFVRNNTDWITITEASAILTLTPPFTVACWFKPDASGISDSFGIFHLDRSTSPYSQLRVFSNTTNKTLNVDVDVHSVNPDTTFPYSFSGSVPSINDNTWQHVMFCIDSTYRAHLLHNGVVVAAADSSQRNSVTTSASYYTFIKYYIGINIINGLTSNYCNGDIGEFYVWKYDATSYAGALSIGIAPADLLMPTAYVYRDLRSSLSVTPTDEFTFSNSGSDSTPSSHPSFTQNVDLEFRQANTNQLIHTLNIGNDFRISTTDSSSQVFRFPIGGFTYEYKGTNKLNFVDGKVYKVNFSTGSRKFLYRSSQPHIFYQG